MAVFKGFLLITIVLLVQHSWSALGGLLCNGVSQGCLINTKAGGNNVQDCTKDTCKISEDVEKAYTNSTATSQSQLNSTQMSDLKYQKNINETNYDMNTTHIDIDKDMEISKNQINETEKSRGSGVVCYTTWNNCKDTNNEKVVYSGSKSCHKYCFNKDKNKGNDSYSKIESVDIEKKKCSISDDTYKSLVDQKANSTNQVMMCDKYDENHSIGQESKSLDVSSECKGMGQKSNSYFNKNMDTNNGCGTRNGNIPYCTGNTEDVNNCDKGDKKCGCSKD